MSSADTPEPNVSDAEPQEEPEAEPAPMNRAERRAQANHKKTSPAGHNVLKPQATPMRPGNSKAFGKVRFPRTGNK